VAPIRLPSPWLARAPDATMRVTMETTAVFEGMTESRRRRLVLLARADVWVRIGDELVPEAMWPNDADPLTPIPASEDDAGDATPHELREPFRHQGELLGALSIVKRPGESIATEAKLVRDLAGQAAW
jgi:hypothetical protein